ncbi:release factor glutamine methyltransferase [Herpetosiphon giganteus]|nr:peptide chain release factor N(5)-glutamine methyltransferase [Herpetosiphon giganteus]MBM7846696.1 release factor glutamine methyltransferase [Herpetosiphon giganteus]
MATITLREALIEAANQLSSASLTPQLDARVLLAHVLGLDSSQILARFNEHLEAEHAAAFQALIERRNALEPIAYLIGAREFYGLTFNVDQRVLVPRPDTEILVEQALTWIKQQNRPLVVADIGTGSGCIAVAVAKHAPNIKLYAVDLSPAALAVAQSNVERHGLHQQIQLIHGDGVSQLPEPIDLLLSNPPYTLLDEIEPGVRLHEPTLALDGGPDGLDCYRQLLPATATVLRQGQPTAALFEIGAWQGPDVVALAQASFPHATIQLLRDLAARDRVVQIEQA